MTTFVERETRGPIYLQNGEEEVMGNAKYEPLRTKSVDDINCFIPRKKT